MVRIWFAFERKNKGRVLDLINSKFKDLLRIDLSKPIDSSKRSDSRTSLDKFHIILNGNKYILLRQTFDVSSDKYMSVSFNFPYINDEKSNDKILNMIREIIKSKLIERSESLLQTINGKELIYKEIILCRPNKDDFPKNLRFDELRPDHKEEMDDDYIMIFESMYKSDPNENSLANCSFFDFGIRLNYLGTDKYEDVGSKIYYDDNKNCKRLVIGKIFHGLESGALVNDESDILKALNNADIILRKRGKCIADIDAMYKEITSNLKPSSPKNA